MGVSYRLVNVTKGEQISFSRLPGGKAHELAGNPASAAIVCWYMLHNIGDRIAFVADELEQWPFDTGSLETSRDFPDATDKYLKQLIQAGILQDKGILWRDEEEPALFLRDIRNAWMPKDLL